MKYGFGKKTIAVAALVVGVGVGGIGFASGASADYVGTPSPALALSPSVTYQANPSADGFIGSTIPQVNCVLGQACAIAANGVGTVALDLVWGPNTSTTTNYNYTNQRWAVWDKSGNFVSYADGFACSQIAPSGATGIRCANTTADFRVTIPAGGNLSPINDSLRRIDIFSTAPSGSTVLTRSLKTPYESTQVADYVKR